MTADREPRRLEYIDGVGLDLGRITLQELLQVEEDCRQRVMNAEAELAVVQDYKERRFPGEPS